jgi:hypothetical protein
MRRCVWLAVLAVGCGESPRPITPAQAVKSETVDPVADLSDAPAPAASDPAAKQLLAEILAAHTSGKPDLLDALKGGFTLTRTGQVPSAPPALNPQTWTVVGGWPDRFRVKAALPTQTINMARDGASYWRNHSLAGPAAVPMAAVEADDFRHETTGEWLALLFPLADPAIIVAPVPPATDRGKAVVGVRVWHPHLTAAIIHVEADTKLLARVSFAGREQGVPMTKEIVVLSRKAWAGVLLPERTVVKGMGKNLAEWTVTAFAPGAADGKLFREP